MAETESADFPPRPGRVVICEADSAMNEPMKNFTNQYVLRAARTVGFTDFPRMPLFFDYKHAKQYSDITIECGKDVYYGHRLVICSQSDFFANACKPGFRVGDFKIISRTY
jgi:hypothetical protein